MRAGSVNVPCKIFFRDKTIPARTARVTALVRTRHVNRSVGSNGRTTPTRVTSTRSGAKSRARIRRAKVSSDVTGRVHVEETPGRHPRGGSRYSRKNTHRSISRDDRSDPVPEPRARGRDKWKPIAFGGPRRSRRDVINHKNVRRSGSREFGAVFEYCYCPSCG